MTATGQCVQTIGPTADALPPLVTTRGRCLGARTCGCGRRFRVYTKYPRAKSCSAGCRNIYSARNRRLVKFQLLIGKRLSERSTLTTTDIAALMQQAWQLGFRAGWHAPHERGHRGRYPL